ncbi:MAG: hypothetical protein JRH20_23690 [Deltaproteobacteria bacterium]|nr:hypothetical protein [Deltaproteobacteria bacterium]
MANDAPIMLDTSQLRDTAVDSSQDSSQDLTPDAATSWPPEFPTNICSDGDWCWDAPQPFGTILTSVWASGRRDIYLVGSRVLLHYDGLEWTRVDVKALFNVVGHTPSFQVVWGSAQDDVYVLAQWGELSRILRFDGMQWSQELEVKGTITALSGWGNGQLVAVGQQMPGHNRTIWGRNVEGWKELGTFGNTYAFSDVWANSATDVYSVAFSFARKHNVLVHFDGVSLEEMLPPEGATLRSIWGDGTDIYVTATQGTGPSVLYRYDGATWHEALKSANRFTSLWGRSASDIYLVESNVGLHHYDGKNWTVDSKPQGITQVQGVGSELLGIGGLGNVALRDSTGWKGLSPQTKPLEGVAHLWAQSPEEVYGLSIRGLWRFDGSDWTLTKAGVPDNPRALGGHDQGLVLLTKDALWALEAGHWSALGTGPFDDGNALWIVDQKQLFVGTKPASGDGAIWEFDGSQWTEHPAQVGPIEALWASAANSAYAAGGRGVAFYDGKSWELVHSWGVTNDGSADIWGSSAERVFAVSGAGKVAHFDGTQWSEQDIGFSLSAVHGSKGDVFIAGGGVLRLDGTLWREENLGIAQSLYDIVATPSKVIVVGNGGLALSRSR